MQKTIYGNVIRYTFGPETIPRVGHNIYAVKSEESLTIIDPSSENMVGEIKKDDDFNADRLENIIISHYHGDHIGGIAQPPKCTVWGSEQYAKTLGNRYPQPLIDLVKPSIDLQYGVHQYTLGGVPVRFYQGRGHTACGILTVIGAEFIHTKRHRRLQRTRRPDTPPDIRFRLRILQDNSEDTGIQPENHHSAHAGPRPDENQGYPVDL